MKVTFKIANKELPMPLAVTVGGEEKVVYDKKDVTEFDLEEKQTKLTVEVKKEKYLDEAKKSKNIFARAILFLLYPLFVICGFSCNAILKLNCIKDLDNCFAESIPFKQKFSFKIEPTDMVNIVYATVGSNQQALETKSVAILTV
ncbi:MAG: hypothetical protein J6B45_01770 [Clostridia bacterium]|nr:hypothetical protein [Clostridia bacterium]